MTIAACYLCPEGVVFGADSTASFPTAGGLHYYNHNQKLFEIGDPGTLGCVTWGLASLGDVSYRTLLGKLSDELIVAPPASVEEVANRWAKAVWSAYAHELKADLTLVAQLQALKAHDPALPAAADMRTAAQESTLADLIMGLSVGFIIGGYVPASREPVAYKVFCDPTKAGADVERLPQTWSFWGAPNMVVRLLFGIAPQLKEDILNSGMWTGSAADLDNLVNKHNLPQPRDIPIRDAVDFVHTCIVSTIKAFKFSSFSQICGGPVEIAVVTTDRRFRWVQHKRWDAAILDGGGV